MADTFNLTAALDAQAYTAGATMTLTVSGSVSGISTATDKISILVTAADGSTTTLTAGPVTVNTTTSPNWVITSVTDGAGRAWTIGSTGKTATATA